LKATLTQKSILRDFILDITKQMKLRFEPITRENWETALKLQVHPHQEKYVPSVAVSLAAAHVKPWDEALDPYLIYVNEILVGFFYISYTPNSVDNYWIGGFFIGPRSTPHRFMWYNILVSLWPRSG